MAVTKTWSIIDMTRETSDNYVSIVRWKITGTEGDKTVESIGKTYLARPESLEDYNSLTEDKVIGWVKAKLIAETPAVQIEDTGKTAVDDYEDLMDKKMGWLSEPATSQGKPF